MAAAQEPLPNSQQRSNSAKLGKFIFQEGTVVLRSLFDRYHSPLNLEDDLRSKIEILRSLRDSNLVSPGEWKILFPDDGSPPTSQKMEAHLLFVLLQNICGLPKPSSGWDKPPETSDEGNDIPGNLAKLNSLISEVARQTTSCGVENMCFQFYWSQITDVVSTLGSVELPFSFEEVKHQPMDKYDEEKYNRLLVEWTMRKIPNQDVAAHFQETAEKLNSVIQRQDETKLQLMQGPKMPFTWSKSSLIGSGCNGTKVYHGQLTSTGQKVAVKKMYNGVFDKGEAEKLRKCKHQNIIHCFAIYEEEEFFYLALELGEKTLMDCIDENKFDSNGGDLLIEKCFVEVASGVAYLHKNNICHRDIKPGNILLMAKNDEYSFQRFVLADLNCARDVPSGETISTQSTVGTPGWMAPEMFGVGCRRTIKIDIFSLGCVYYYTITKKHPYGGDGETLTECQKNINKKQGPSNFMKHFENYKHLNELLLRMMHADLDKRPSASEVLKYLRFSKRQKVIKDLQYILDVLSRFPSLTYQQAAMYPQHGWIAKQAEQMRQKFVQPDPNNIPAPEEWVEWINKPQVPEAFELELSGHSKSVLSTCFARDNRTLLSGSADGTIRVWNSQTGELHAQLEDHHGAVTCVRLSPDGSMMASASADKTVRLWKFPNNEIIRILEGHEERVTCIAFSKDGQRLLSSSKDKTLKLWDLSNGKNLATLPGHRGSPISCAWSPVDDSVAASCGDNLELFIWDLSQSSIRLTLEGHQRDNNPNFPVKDGLEGLKDLDYKSLIWSVCFSPDGKYLASACVDSDVILWDVNSGTKIWTFNLPNDASTVAFAQTEHGTRLAAASSAHHTVNIFDANFDDVSSKHVNGSSRTLALLGGHSDWVIDVAFNEDASRLASAACDRTVRVWDATASENLREARFHAGRCWSVVYSDDGKWLASASDDFKVCVWNMDTLEVSLIYEGHEQKRTFSCGVRACTFSRDASQVASGGDELKIRVWSRETGKDNIVLECGEAMLPWCLRFSLDDKQLVSVGEFTNGAIVWDLESQSKILTLGGHDRFCQYTEFSSSGKFIVTSSIDNSARIWDGGSYVHVTTVSQPDWVTCATFSHKEQLLATCSKDQLVRLWSTSTWQKICEMSGHESEIRMVSFSPDDKFLASGALDQTIRIWDCDTCQQIQVFYAASGIWGLAWHPKESDLFTAGDAVGYLYFLKIHNRKKGNAVEK